MALCECGCGQDAGVYDKTRNGQGMIKGQPKKFILGHSGHPIELARLAPRKKRKKFCPKGHPRIPENLYKSFGCKLCNQLRTTAFRKEHPEENWKLRSTQSRLRKYGMTQGQYEALLKEQEYKCAICHTELEYNTAKAKLKSPRSAHVDHLHDGTKNFRGVLCAMCNRALGLFQDSVETLSNAIQYLNKFKETQWTKSSSLFAPTLT